KATLISHSHHAFPNENLISHGYLGFSPISPSIAFSLQTLATFQQAHWTCPWFTIQAQCKTLCHLHSIPYCPYLCTQFSLAFNVYLEVVHHIDNCIQDALGRNSQDWQLLNECPACFYHLEDEPSLKFDWLVSIDGNKYNSLKWWDMMVYGKTLCEDSCTVRSTYWLSNAEVDQFEYKVKAKQVYDWEMDLDVASSLFNCVNHWCAAKSDQCKKMFSVFEESGIFIVTCWHCFVLLAWNMIKSSEL
ncbi:hypothetical protein PISMIDRAFT_116814, partial [Pisolithus microcarpus 441]